MAAICLLAHTLSLKHVGKIRVATSPSMMAICDLDMFFTFVLIGWEGSAVDSPLYHWCFDHGLKVPEGKYFLVGAGFGACDTLLTPYWQSHYHLHEWLAG